MLEFVPLRPEDKALYEKYRLTCGERGCEYSFANLFLWGRQKITIHRGNLAFFSQFNRKTVYPYPLGKDVKPTLDALIHDARKRGIPCRLTGLTKAESLQLEQWYPQLFDIRPDRDSLDYV